MEKGENACYRHFLPFPIMFSIGFRPMGHHKLGLCGKGLTLCHRVQSYDTLKQEGQDGPGSLT